MRPAKSGRRRPSKKKRGWLRCWWPLLVALAVTPFALRAASVLALSGPHALTILFPFVAFTRMHWAAPYAAAQQETLAEWAMWAQFPLYGLLASLLACAGRISRALVVVLLVHILAIAAALLLV